MARAPARSRRKRGAASPWKASIVLGGALAALAAVNAWVFYFSRHSIPAILERPDEPRLPKAAGAAQAEDAPVPAAAPVGKSGAAKSGAPGEVEVEAGEADEGRTATGEIGEGDTLSSVLKREGVPQQTAGEVIAALTKELDARTVRAGHGYVLRWDAEDRLRALEYRTTPATRFLVERHAAERPGGKSAKGADEGREAWRASRETAEITTRVEHAGGTIDSSLYEAIKRAGESAALVGFFVDMFAWDVNFYVDTNKGDQWRVVVEKLYLGDTFYKYGRVLAAEYSGKVGTYRAFHYQPSPGRPGGYYTERGESIVKSLLKTPLKYVRVSSQFDRKRMHPILHTERAHLGVDYAAPTGTPVWATAEGKVTWKGSKGGAGEAVIVAHPGGMESIYMHLSRYAKGLSVGDVVRQKQVIGYVGATGLATGPHLHFSVKIGGHFVDPMRLKPVRAASIPASQREAFARTVGPLREEMERIDTSARVARGATP